MSNEQMTDARVKNLLRDMDKIIRRDDGEPVWLDPVDAAYIAARLRGEAAQPRVSDLLVRAIPFLRDEGGKYDDDGSNEPLELARAIEDFLSTSPSDESALSSASSAFDGGEVDPCPHGSGRCDCSHPPAQGEQQAVACSRPNVACAWPECGTECRHLPQSAAPAPVAGEAVAKQIAAWLESADGSETSARLAAQILGGFGTVILAALAQERPVAGDAVRKAAAALLDKLVSIHGSSEYQAVWQIAQSHRGRYTGPKYDEEMTALEAALAQDRAAQAGAAGVPECPVSPSHAAQAAIRCAEEIDRFIGLREDYDLDDIAVTSLIEAGKALREKAAMLAAAPTPGAEGEVP